MAFCSACGVTRPPRASICSNCSKDFRYLTEVNAYPFMLCVRRKIHKSLSPAVTGTVTLNEFNVPLEIFYALFGSYGMPTSENVFLTPSSPQNSVESEKGSPGPSPKSTILASDSRLETKLSLPSSKPACVVRRVIWKKSELDAICKFQCIDPTRGYGCSLMIPESLGCAAVIPPLCISHVSSFEGEQNMTVSFSYAFLNSSSMVLRPSNHCLDLTFWGGSGPAPAIDSPHRHIVDMLASCPSDLRSNGVQVPEILLKSACAILENRVIVEDPLEEEERRGALLRWAEKARSLPEKWGSGKYSVPISSLHLYNDKR